MLVVVDHNSQNIERILPVVKEREEVLYHLSTGPFICNVVDTYLIHSVCLIIVDYPDLHGIRKVKYSTFFNLQHIPDRQRDLDAIPLVVCSEDNFLDGSHPLLRTHSTICFELKCPFIGGDREYGLFLVLSLGFKYSSRNGVLQVDAVAWKV